MTDMAKPDAPPTTPTADRLVPPGGQNRRFYLGLREEGDHFIGLIRKLNETAIARDGGHEHDERFRHTLEEMHASVERMSELAGQATDP